MLKEDAHRGQGVAVVPEAEALAKAGSARLDGGQGGLEMVQAYLGNQYTVAGRRFYLRCLLWRSQLVLGACLPADPGRMLHAMLKQAPDAACAVACMAMVTRAS